MKKAIILALAVAGASASTANATWQTGANVLENPAISTPGELIVTVWNEATYTSFTQDLGAQVWQWLDGSASPQSFTLDAAGLAHVAGNQADIHWNVAGLNYNVKAADGVNPHRDHRGIYATSNGGVPWENYNGANFSGSLSFFQDYSKLRLWEGESMVLSGTTENPVFLLSGAFYAGSDDIWGSPMSGLNTPFGQFFTAGDDLDTLAAYSISFEAVGNWIPAVTQRGFWQVDMQSGKLNYMSELTTVPVPAAAWLFASALLGMAGIGRTRRMKAQPIK